MHLRAPMLLASVLALPAADAAFAARARAQESPLVFQGNLFDALPEPFFPTMFRARDLDGDGFPDLVIAGRDPDDRVMTRRGDGNGRFVEQQVLAAPGFIDWLELGDMDGDGRLDIVASWRGDRPTLVVYRGIGPGLFEEATVVADVVIEGVGRDPQGIALGDFDRDGDLDVAVTNYIGQSLDVFMNEGSAKSPLRFARAPRLRLASFFGGIAYPRVVAAGDMDGDGDLDLVANEIGGGRVAVIRNEAGRFVRPIEYRVPQIGNERPGISGLELADVDGDGDLDVFCPALLLEQTQKVVTFLNDGSGALVERLVGEGSPTGYSFCAHLADLDGDGDLDALSGAALPGTIAVARRTAAGAFTFEVDFAPQFGQFIRHIDAVDVDGDCDLDIVGIEAPSRTVFVRRNITPQQQSCGGLAELAQKSAADEAVPSVDSALPAAGASARGSPRPSASTSASPPAPVRAPIAAIDTNRDGVIDAADVAVWLAGWSRSALDGGAR